MTRDPKLEYESHTRNRAQSLVDRARNIAAITGLALFVIFFASRMVGVVAAFALLGACAALVTALVLAAIGLSSAERRAAAGGVLVLAIILLTALIAAAYAIADAVAGMGASH